MFEIILPWSKPGLCTRVIAVVGPVLMLSSGTIVPETGVSKAWMGLSLLLVNLSAAYLIGQ